MQEGYAPVRASNPLRVILVVEDEWLVRGQIANELQGGGWEVLEASTGEDALTLLEATGHCIDVVFTDIQLAGNLSGWDVADAFRSAHPQMPIIYASGNAIDPARVVADSRFFRKPYPSRAILEACEFQVSSAHFKAAG